MYMKAIVTEWSTPSTDDARDLVNAAQVILKGDQTEVRNLCKPWGVQLKEKKRYRPIDTLKQEPKMALTKRAKKLKSENEVCNRGTAADHASAEFCIEAAMAETLRRIKAIQGDSEILVRSSTTLAPLSNALVTGLLPCAERQNGRYPKNFATISQWMRADTLQRMPRVACGK